MSEAQLRARIEELEEEVRQLRQQLVPVIALPKAWGLTTFEARLLLAIRSASPNLVTRNRAMVALYGVNDAPEYNVVDTLLSRMRQRLAAIGLPVVIENRRGLGWRMSRMSARAFDDALSKCEVA